MSFNQIKILYQNKQSQLLTLAYFSLVLCAFFSALSVTAMNIFITAAAILCLISGKFFSEWPLLKNNSIFWAILLLMALLFVGMFWSIAPPHDRWSALHKYGKLLYIPLLVPLCLDPIWRRRSINAFLCAMMLTVLLSYLKQFAGLDLGEESVSSWVFHGHIETSYFIAFATYIFAYRGAYEHRYRAGYWLLTLLFSYQQFFINDSRTGWAVYFSLLLLFCLQSAVILVGRKYSKNALMIYFACFRWLIYALLFIFSMIVVSYVFSFSFRENVSEAVYAVVMTAQGTLPTDGHHYVSSSEFRMLFIKFSLDLAAQHPWLGLGTGAFQQAYRNSPGIPGWWGDELNNPHNEYLFMLVQMGIVGLLALLYFFFTLLRASFQRSEDNFLAQGFLFSFFVACCYNSFLYLTITGHFFVLFASLLCVSNGFGLQKSVFLKSIEAK